MSTIEREKTATVPEVRPVTTREVLHRAADLLEEFGWCQGTWARDAAGNAVLETAHSAVALCARGAVRRAEREFSTCNDDAEYAMYQDGFMTCWNDAPYRTKDEVVAYLRGLADRA